MDYLWSPWRYQYVTTAERAVECIFCVLPAEHRDRENYIVYRGRFNFVILNRFPYTSGHLMVVPYEHAPSLEAVAEDTLLEMILLARQAETHLRANYQPDGLNMGINVGKAAGAGVAGLSAQAPAVRAASVSTVRNSVLVGFIEVVSPFVLFEAHHPGGLKNFSPSEATTQWDIPAIALPRVHASYWHYHYD